MIITRITVDNDIILGIFDGIIQRPWENTGLWQINIGNDIYGVESVKDSINITDNNTTFSRTINLTKL